MLSLNVKSLMRLQIDMNRKDKNVLSIIKQNNNLWAHTFSHIKKKKQPMQFLLLFSHQFIEKITELMRYKK